MIGVFLYYSKVTNSTMLVALSTISPEQENTTKITTKKVKKFLIFAASYQDAIVTYHASDIILACHSNALHLNETKARSWVGGNCFLSENGETTRNNGSVLNTDQIIKVVMTLEAEVEIKAMYENNRKSLPQTITPIERGHQQPKTSMQTDNLAVK